MNVLESLFIYGLKDISEIGVMSLLVYIGSKWLISSKQYRLLLSVYGYFALSVLCALVNFTTLFTLLQFAAPLFGIALVIIHQKTIFKNIQKTPVLYTPAKSSISGDWVSAAVRLIYLSAQENKLLSVVIQGRREIEGLFHDGLKLDAPITGELVDLLHESKRLTHSYFLLVRHDGVLTYLNSKSLIQADDEQPLLDRISSITDCLIITFDSKTRLFDLYVHATVIKGLSADHATQSIQLFIKKLTQSHGLEGMAHEHSSRQAPRH